MRSLRLSSALVVVLVLAASACRQDPAVAATEYAKRGDDYVQAKKDREAVIEYRNALQLDAGRGDVRLKLADLYAKLQDLPNALNEYVRAADQLPQNVDAQMKAAEILLWAGRFEDAGARADKALALNPKNVVARIQKGNALAGLKNMDGAIATLEEAIRADPSKVSGYSALAAVRLVGGDATKAEIAYKQAANADPKSVQARLALGGFYWSRGKFEAAESEVRQAVALEPENILANRTLALFLLGNGRIAEAEAPLKIVAAKSTDPVSKLALADYYTTNQRTADAKALYEALAEQPDTATQAKLRLAALGYAMKDKPAAYKLIEEVLKQEPKNSEALVGRAQLLLTDQKLDEALASAREAVAADRTSPQAQYTLGVILSRRGDREGASDAFQEAILANPKFALAQYELARNALALGEPARAVGYAESAIQAAPRMGDAYLVLARAQIASGNPKAAERPLAILRKEFPDASAIQAELGRLELAKGNTAAARTAFERTLASDSGDVLALQGLTQIDLREGRRDAARQRLDQALAKLPNNGPLHAFAGQLYGSLGDGAAAERAARKAVALAPDDLNGYAALAGALAQQNRLADAVVELDNIAKKQPKTIGYQTAAAVLVGTQGKWDDAIRRYQQILAIDPSAAVAANNLASIYADRNQDLDVALQLAQTAKSQMQDRPEVDDTLGWIYYRKNLSSLAISSLQASVARDPNNPGTAYHLGLAYVQGKLPAKGRTELERALKLSQNFDGADEARRVLATLK